jgi:hypothetical protein
MGNEISKKGLLIIDDDIPKKKRFSFSHRSLEGWLSITLLEI